MPKATTTTTTDTIGNNYSTAYNIGTLSAGYSTTEAVSAQDRYDYYQFTLTTTSSLTLELSNLGGDAQVTLINPAGSGSTVGYSANPGTLSESISVDSLSAGAYYVKIWFTSGSIASYDLNLSATPLMIDGAGNTKEEAKTIGTLGTAVKKFSDWIGPTDTVDFVKFEVDKYSSVHVNLDGLSQDADVQLLNSSGTVIAASTLSSSKAEDIFASLVSGTYYVKIYPAALGVASNYDLSLNATPLSALTDDFSADKKTTGLVTIDQYTTGVIEKSGDVDWFKVYLTEGQTVQVNLDGLNLADPKIKGIYSSGGSLMRLTTNDNASSATKNAEMVFTADKSGYYYVAASAAGSGTGTYSVQVTDRSDPYFVQQLDTSYHWENTGGTIFYRFAEPQESTDHAFSTQQQEAVRTALAKYTAVTGLHFVEATASTSANISFFITDLEEGTAGEAYYPGTYSTNTGNVYFDTSIMGQVSGDKYTSTEVSTTEGDYTFQVFLHEIGHAMGLYHSFNGNLGTAVQGSGSIPLAEDNFNNTVMTYPFATENYTTYPTDLKIFDIATLQSIYGVNTSVRSGNDTYQFSATDYIWDGAGTDTLNAADQTQNLNINLESGSWIYAGAKASSIFAAGQSFIGYGTVIERAIGGSGKDIIRGNDAANQLTGNAGNDTLEGGSGNDTLDGGSGKDTLWGGIGRDIFLFSTQPSASSTDTLADFNVAQDTIQLAQSSFSALTKGTLSSTMLYVTNTAGVNHGVDSNDYLIYNQKDGCIFYDADGNGGTAAIKIALIGSHLSLTASDFEVV